MKKRTRYFIAKAITSPRHFLNAALVILSYRFRSVTTHGHPIVVDLEPSNYCNFHCSHCEITYKERNRKKLSKDQYDVIMSQLPYAFRVKLQGEGEPFVNDLLYDLIKDTCSKGVWCEVVTNGSMLDIKKLKQLERFRNFQLIFSFDAADKTTFEKIRAGSNFETILENLEEITRKTTISIGTWMLLQKKNKEQVEDVIRLLASKRVKSLGIQKLFFNFDRKAKMPDSIINGTWQKQGISKSSCSVLRKLAKKSGMQLSISDKLYNRSNLCPWPWMGVFIDTSGNVVPCCRIGDSSICKMGNLNEVNIFEIWNSKEYTDFRRRHKINDLPEFCKGCYSSDPDSSMDVKLNHLRPVDDGKGE